MIGWGWQCLRITVDGNGNGWWLALFTVHCSGNCMTAVAASGATAVAFLPPGLACLPHPVVVVWNKPLSLATCRPLQMPRSYLRLSPVSAFLQVFFNQWQIGRSVLGLHSLHTSIKLTDTEEDSLNIWLLDSIRLTWQNMFLAMTSLCSGTNGICLGNVSGRR